MVLTGSRIDRDNGSDQPLLTLTTENTSQFPIPGVAGQLRIGKDDNNDSKFVDSPGSQATLLSSTVTANKKYDMQSLIHLE
jgi:hypothetical protein